VGLVLWGNEMQKKGGTSFRPPMAVNNAIGQIKKMFKSFLP
jgi:hypothetical protein